MIPYTRVTLLAPDRRAEVVIPSDEAVGVQYPALLALLGLSEGADLPSIQLVRPDGTLVDPELDLVAQKVRDGEILRLIPDDEVPPPAEISDVAGALTQATDSHPWRWKASDRILGTGTLLLVVGLILARTWLQEGSGGLPHWSWPLPGLAVVAAGALVFRFAGPCAGGGDPSDVLRSRSAPACPRAPRTRLERRRRGRDGPHHHVPRHRRHRRRKAPRGLPVRGRRGRDARGSSPAPEPGDG